MTWFHASTYMLIALATYFTILNLSYVALFLVSFRSISLFAPSRVERYLPPVFSGLMPPVTLLVPAYNEKSTITTTLRSLLQLEYAAFEIVCVNDGSTDGMMETLKENFELELITQAPRCELATKEIKGIYISNRYKNLRVVDKENGGKADALNAGINYSNHELVCCIDADSILQRDSLQGIVRPFLEDPTTVAVGGTVRLANGCEVRDGHMVRRGLPASFLVKLQTLEYLRAFLFGAIGWAHLNSLLVISGAFGLFKRQTLLDVGGYRTGTVGEDMELILRIHRFHRLNRLPYRVHFMADPICWTEAPEDLKTLKNQRVRWQRGLAESLSQNKALFMNPRAGIVGLFAVPFFVLFELLGPVVGFSGLVFMIVAVSMGYVEYQYIVALTLMWLGSGLFLSTMAILLEEAFFHSQVRLRDFLWLFSCAIIENFGYRQLNTYYQFLGIRKWLFSHKSEWGEMSRKAKWTASPSSPS